MSSCSRRIRYLCRLADTLLTLGVDTIRFLQLWLRSPAALAAENLFLRKQLALYQERNVKPKRAPNAACFALVWLSRWFDWRPALAVVQPETFSRWRRQGGGLLWRWKSPPGRPPIPADLQALIRHMARDNPTWVRGALPMSCDSSSACGSRREPSAHMCPRAWTAVQATACRPSAGGRSCAITRGPSSSMVFPRTPPKACRPYLLGLYAYFSVGGADPAQTGCKGPLRMTAFSFPSCALSCRDPHSGLRTP
jgi:hypothetical protein